jgi:signal transduction histidine kinase/CheY-like chemotaxis protein
MRRRSGKCIEALCVLESNPSSANDDQPVGDASASVLSAVKTPSPTRARVAAGTTLIIGLTLTAVATMMEKSAIHRETELHFEQLAGRLQAELVSRLRVYRYGLISARGLFVASERIEQHEFKRMVEQQHLEVDFPGTLGLGFIQRVSNTPESLSDFVAKARADGVPDFSIKVPPNAKQSATSFSDDRMIVKYIEPLEGNQTALGLDIGAHLVSREAAERAMFTGEASITGHLQLMRNGEKLPGFIYVLPVYHDHLPTGTTQERTDALEGWVYMLMVGPDVFAGLDMIAEREIDIDVFDGSELLHDAIIFDSDNHLDYVSQGQIVNRGYAGRSFYKTVPLEVGGRTWTLAMSTTDSFVAAPSTMAFASAITGGLFTLLLSTVIYMQSTAAHRAQSIANRMTADLRRLAFEAKNATQAKSEFLANMSHEIRTPMTAIMGYADVLNELGNDPSDRDQQHECVETIKRNGEHLLAIINDILDISKIEAGKMVIERIDTHPHLIVREVYNLMMVKSNAKHIDLSLRFNSQMPEHIQSDPIRLRQILVNLVGNAIKFTEHGEVKISTSYNRSTNMVTYEIADTGIGMNDKQIEKLFNAFEQADGSTTRQYGGTGLGLRISKRLAEMLGGDIRVKSTPGVGSTFSVSVCAGSVRGVPMLNVHRSETISSLPDASQPNGSPTDPPKPVAAGSAAPGPGSTVQQPEQPGKAHAKPDGGSGTASEMPLSGLRILLAEDGPDNQRLISHYLRKSGAEVTVVENGMLAVEALTIDGTVEGLLTPEPPFDMLLSDMQMPEMDGYTAVRLLRRKGFTLPIVALTANAMTGDDEKCLSAGCDRYATKPIKRKALIEVCAEVTAKAELPVV